MLSMRRECQVLQRRSKCRVKRSLVIERETTLTPQDTGTVKDILVVSVVAAAKGEQIAAVSANSKRERFIEHLVAKALLTMIC
jgi:hypothetical protein